MGMSLVFSGIRQIKKKKERKKVFQLVVLKANSEIWGLEAITEEKMLVLAAEEEIRLLN